MLVSWASWGPTCEIHGVVARAGAAMVLNGSFRGAAATPSSTSIRASAGSGGRLEAHTSGIVHLGWTALANASCPATCFMRVALIAWRTASVMFYPPLGVAYNLLKQAVDEGRGDWAQSTPAMECQWFECVPLRGAVRRVFLQFRALILGECAFAALDGAGLARG